MERISLDKLECNYSAIFKALWSANVVWIIVEIANYFGHWLAPDKLDGLGMSVLFLFAVSIFICFRKGFIKLISQHRILTVDNITKKVASYAFLISFVIMLLFSIWDICGTTDNHTNFSTNGGSQSIPYETMSSIVDNIIKAFIVSIVSVIIYWYIRVCFVLFSGRISRIGVEVAISLIIVSCLSVYSNDNIWVNAVVVLIAIVFLYEIWCFADFQETHLSLKQIERMISEDTD